ncbi:ArnT family glycosyltransferase [Schlesneria sp.]|uniref:ArnT family glycosyltransferase n=1 Tax=Schlesneria sp. TaxID=2762018 RepID=UPI002F136C49
MDASKQRSRPERLGLILLLMLAAGLRLAVILMHPDELTQDRDAYLGIATGVAQGRGFSSPGSTQPTAYRPPLYPLMLAAGLMAFPAPIVVAGINLVAGVLGVWLTERLGDLLKLGRSRFLAAGLVAVDPMLLRYVSQPMTESVCTLLAVLWIWSASLALTSPNGRAWCRWLFSGLSFGLLVLCRPTFWPIVLFWYGGSYLVHRRQRSDNRGSAWGSLASQWICGATGTALVVGPWIVRNWWVLGVPILTTTHGGYTLFLSNNPVFYQEVVQQPWGTVWQNQSLTEWQADIESQIQQQLGAEASEVARDKWYSQQGRRTIAAEPQLFAKATLHRVRSLWNTVPQGEAAEQVSGNLVLAIGWYYGAILILGFCGAILIGAGRGSTTWLPLYAMIVTVQLAHLVYWTNARMRAPLTPAISLFVAGAVSRSVRPREVSPPDHGTE